MDFEKYLEERSNTYAPSRYYSYEVVEIMTNKELQEYLKKFPDDYQVKALTPYTHDTKVPKGITDENIIIRTDTVWINDEAPGDEWDTEDGKVELGDGERFLLLNAPVL